MPRIAACIGVAGLAICLAALPGIAAEGDTPPVFDSTGMLSFDAALERALARSPASLVAGGARELAAAQLRRARAWENPTLDIESENVLGNGVYRNFDSAETRVMLSQPLPLGGARAALVRGAEAGAVAAQALTELAGLEIRHDVAVAYAEAIAADRLANIEHERARLGAETQRAVERRFAAGLESALQLARVEVEQSGRQAAERRAAAEAQSRRRALAALWRESLVSEPLDGVWFDRAPPGYGDATGQNPVAEHPRTRLAQAEISRARASLDGARAQRFAGLEAKLGTRRFAGATSEGDQAFLLGLSMPLPLWDRNGAGIVEARNALSAAQIDAERIDRELQGARATAVAQFEAAGIEVTALTNRGLPAAESAAQLAGQGYEAGRLSLFERLDAERALSEVRERLEHARLERQRAWAGIASLR